jgi:hypothetical protein
MLVRSSRLVLAFALALPTVAVAQAFEYATGTSRYRVTQTTKVAQEAMGQKQEFESSNNQVMTVTLARAAKDTLAMAIVLDSIVASGPMGPTPGLEKLMGMKVNAKISPAGAFYSSAGPKDEAIPNASTIADAMGRFLPKIRAKLAKGAAWTDTITGRIALGGIDVDRKTVSKYVVAGDTTFGGEKSWKVMKQDSTSMSGSGAPQGQAMTMEGTSTGNGTLFVSPKGVFLGAEGEEVSNLKIVLSANGMEIGVTQTANTKVAKVN